MGRGTFVVGLEEAEAAARMTVNGDVEGDFGPVGEDFRWGDSEAGLVSGESRVHGVDLRLGALVFMGALVKENEIWGH